jgi:hypothetical protein
MDAARPTRAGRLGVRCCRFALPSHSKTFGSRFITFGFARVLRVLRSSECIDPVNSTDSATETAFPWR